VGRGTSLFVDGLGERPRSFSRPPDPTSDPRAGCDALNAVPVVAVAAGYVLERIARESTLMLLGAVLATLLVALASFAFLVLPQA
jgi:hypothetical protein